jgi:hypothetical protein
MQIVIVGGGLFGITAFLVLKSSGHKCVLLEKEKKLMLGASTNNLNRLHLGYHYPRSKDTAKQSVKGFKSFSKFYKSSIVRYFKNYYLISLNNSLINFKDYLDFCKKNKLPFKVIKDKNFFTKINKKIKNIEGIIKVQEPIYSWKKISYFIKNKIKIFTKHFVFTSTEVLEITKKKNKFLVKTKNKILIADIIIDASYFSLKYKSLIKKKFKKYFNNIFYQITIIPEIIFKNVGKFGLAIMDGPFFSILPKGIENKHLFYHVKYSVISNNKKNAKNFYSFKKKNYFHYYKKLKKIMSLQLNYFLPEIKYRFTNKFYISRRVLLKNKNDSRVSSILEIQKNYFLISSGKVDHCVDVAKKLDNIISKLL